uniref:Uncharacterized protein n=1 Tax=Anser brachyrhynchus TaxID=132585 RepID=A0A8B9D1X0_9AVES
MSSLTEKDKPIVQLLLNTGTCPRCIFRFCRVGSQTLYRHPYKVCRYLISLRYHHVGQINIAIYLV